jgi:hypothetical protein
MERKSMGYLLGIFNYLIFFNLIEAKKVAIGIDSITPILPTKVRTISVLTISVLISRLNVNPEF